MKKYNVNLFNLPGYVVTSNFACQDFLQFNVKSTSKSGTCPKCSRKTRTFYEVKTRKIRHTNWHDRPTFLIITSRKFKCKRCKYRFWERFNGILPHNRNTQNFKKQVAFEALNGHDYKKVSFNYHLGQATVTRWVLTHADLEVREKLSNVCPRVLGIDEHFFTRAHGYATTVCDLVRRKVFDVVLGRSEKSLDAYFLALENKWRTRIIVMDLSGSYKALVKKHFPRALIVADRFHVIRLVNHRFLETWKILDPLGRQNRGLVSLFRRKPSNLSLFQKLNLRRYLRSKPGLEALYDFKNEIYNILMNRGVQKKQMRQIITKYFEIIKNLKDSGFTPLISLAKTLESWQEEILRMLRFSRTNACTEGFHNKMERISRVAYGFRNFRNYRLRVLMQCA